MKRTEPPTSSDAGDAVLCAFEGRSFVLLLLGTIVGLLSAVGQSISYVLSRRATAAGTIGPVQMLAASHVVMGMVALPAAVALWPGPEAASHLVAIGWATALYMAGQAALVWALRLADASRVSPLLGMKVIAVAVLAVLWLNESLNAGQWIGVCLAASSAIALNFTGGRMPALASLATLVACLAYAACDICLGWVTLSLAPQLGLFHTALLIIAITYSLGGFIGLLVLPVVGSPSPAGWNAAVGFAAPWLTAMVLLMVAFGAVGVVLAGIFQAFRGIFSIAIGLAVARRGHHHLESHINAKATTRRILAACGMVVAAGIYLMS